MEKKGGKRQVDKAWILSGDKANWEVAISDKIWGVREGNLKKQWEKLEKGDLLFFYSKAPVKGLIGLGTVESTFKQDKPLWPDEMEAGKVIYPYRFGFNIIYYLPDNWDERSINVGDLGLAVWSGLNSLRREDAIKEVLNRMEEKWGVSIPEIEIKTVAQSVKKTEKGPSLHNQIRDMLYEIGLSESFISEKEYVIDGERLDVTWRRVARGVPTKVFEVQVGGSIHQALSKLKHSYDLWNSEIFLVIDPQHKQKADELLSGTFHEIAEKIKVFTTNDVQNLYSQLISAKELKEGMGL